MLLAPAPAQGVPAPLASLELAAPRPCGMTAARCPPARGQLRPGPGNCRMLPVLRLLQLLRLLVVLSAWRVAHSLHTEELSSYLEAFPEYHPQRQSADQNINLCNQHIALQSSTHRESTLQHGA